MKNDKYIHSFNEARENLNISDVITSCFVVKISLPKIDGSYVEFSTFNSENELKNALKISKNILKIKGSELKIWNIKVEDINNWL